MKGKGDIPYFYNDQAGWSENPTPTPTLKGRESS